MMKGEAWLALAACKGAELDFYDSERSNVAACIAVCKGCQGCTGCLEYALDMERSNDSNRWGVWGGKTPDQRSRIERQRAKVRSRK